MRTFNLYKQKPIMKKMKISQHTNGKWEIKKCEESGPFLDSFYLSSQVETWDGNQDERMICHLPTGTGQFSEIGRENLANARLISSAPDLLDALQAFVDAFIHQDNLLTAQAKAAIAKAKGEA
jgi:hypothetical protein